MDGGMRSSMKVVALPAVDDWAVAIACQRAGDTASAIEGYERHLAQHPDDVDGWLTLASALRSTARTDAALVCCQRALRLAPHCAAVWTSLGILWLVLGHYEQALRCHRNAIALDGTRIRPRLEYARTLSLSVFKQVRRVDVFHVERRVFAHQHRVQFRQRQLSLAVEGEPPVLVVLDAEPPRSAEGFVAARVQIGLLEVMQLPTARLGSQQHGEGGIFFDGDGRDGIHHHTELDGHGKQVLKGG